MSKICTRQLNDKSPINNSAALYHHLVQKNTLAMDLNIQTTAVLLKTNVPKHGEHTLKKHVWT